MGEITREIDMALKNTIPSLSTISGERIRDEFLKGIKSSKSTKHFLTLIDKYGLFNWIFKGLKVNKNFVDDKDPILVISALLKDNDPLIVNKQLNNLKYTIDETKAITFLIKLLGLTPENAIQLKRTQKISGVTDNQIESFGGIFKVNPKLLNAFLKFRLTVNGNELMQQLNLKPGKELGNAINQAEFENFKKLL